MHRTLGCRPQCFHVPQWSNPFGSRPMHRTLGSRSMYRTPVAGLSASMCLNGATPSVVGPCTEPSVVGPCTEPRLQASVLPWAYVQHPTSGSPPMPSCACGAVGSFTPLHRSLVASLVIATAWWIARAPLARACWLAPLAPSCVSRGARRDDGDDSLLVVTTATIRCIRAIRSCTLACAPGAVNLPRFARHRDGVVDRSRASRARVLACASRAIARLSRCSPSRRR